MAEDLPVVQDLMAHPQMHLHRPDPFPPPPDQITRTHAADLAHWKKHRFGRYLALSGVTAIGLCGLSKRDGMEGLNLSYHLAPAQWGRGLATQLVQSLVAMAQEHLSDQGPLYGLLRPANPASARVLIKTGFTPAGYLPLGGAPTTRYIFEIN